MLREPTSRSGSGSVMLAIDDARALRITGDATGVETNSPVTSVV